MRGAENEQDLNLFDYRSLSTLLTAKVRSDNTCILTPIPGAY